VLQDRARASLPPTLIPFRPFATYAEKQASAEEVTLSPKRLSPEVKKGSPTLSRGEWLASREILALGPEERTR
jgi:hypothetical protein